MHKSGTLHLLANVLIYHRMSLSKSDINFTLRYIRYIRLLIFCSDEEYLYDYETSFPLNPSSSRPSQCL